MHDPELLTQERKAAGNIIRQVMQVTKRSIVISLLPEMGVLIQAGDRTGWDPDGPECWLPQLPQCFGPLAQGKQLVTWPDFPMQRRFLRRLHLPLL